jgi:hypothetical protein
MRWVDKATRGKIPYKFGERIQPYSKKKSYLLCPECGQPVKLQCLCPIQDSMCENGHKWHLEFREGKAIVTRGEGVH